MNVEAPRAERQLLRTGVSDLTVLGAIDAFGGVGCQREGFGRHRGGHRRHRGGNFRAIAGHLRRDGGQRERVRGPSTRLRGRSTRGFVLRGRVEGLRSGVDGLRGGGDGLRVDGDELGCSVERRRGGDDALRSRGGGPRRGRSGRRARFAYALASARVSRRSISAQWRQRQKAVRYAPLSAPKSIAYACSYMSSTTSGDASHAPKA